MNHKHLSPDIKIRKRVRYGKGCDSIINPKIAQQTGDIVSQYGKWTVVKSFSGIITKDKLLENLITYYSKYDK